MCRFGVPRPVTAALLGNTMVEDCVISLVAMYSGVKPEDVKPESELDALGLDSLDRVELVKGIEDQLEVNLDDDEFEACNTVGELVALVEREASK